MYQVLKKYTQAIVQESNDRIDTNCTSWENNASSEPHCSHACHAIFGCQFPIKEKLKEIMGRLVYVRELLIGRYFLLKETQKTFGIRTGLPIGGSL